jgi:hypothetical protein
MTTEKKAPKPREQRNPSDAAEAAAARQRARDRAGDEALPHKSGRTRGDAGSK